MKPYLILFLFWLFPLLASSQPISGNVQDSEGKPVPFANILVLHVKDSSLVKGAVSDEMGAYIIEKLSKGTYLIAATMIGYKKVYSSLITITAGQVSIKVPMLTLPYETKELKEVTISATRPFIEQQIDRTVVNVANSIISSGSTALEVLEKAPGVTVDRQNDGISLRGKEGVIVQIDGKPTYLSMADVVALLRSTPSDNIDNIELITNPSAKYDAAGNSGIINIRLKKNNLVGTNGSASIAGGSGRYDRERASLQLNRRGHKYSIFGNYSANNGGNYWDFDLSRNQADGEQRNIVDQQSYIRFRERGQNAKVGVDYLVSKNTTIGLVWTGFWNNTQEKSPARTSFRRQESGPVYLQTLTDKTLSNQSSNQVGNLNLQHTFGSKGGQLTADFDIGHFSRMFNNNLNTSVILSDAPNSGIMGLFTQMPTAINILTLKADYNRTLWGGWKMETGLKSSNVSSDNNMTLSSGPVGELQLDPNLSNHFQYQERVNAVYANLSGKIGSKTEIQMGLRAEQTHSTGFSVNLDQKVNRDYLNFFPSFFISNPLSKNHNLTFSYSYRIDRPNYQNLNPARGYLDPYAFSRGNPFLKPQYTQAMELKHGYKNTVFTSFGANHVRDYVFFIIQSVDHEKAERTPENIGNSQAYNLNISFPITIMNGWTLQTSLLGVYSRLQFNYQGTPLKVEQVSGRINGSNSILLGKGWTAELTGWLNTPAIYAIFHTPWLGSIDAGIQKSINSKWKAKLSVQDLLHSNQIIAQGRAPGFSQKIRIGFDTRVAMLNLTYSFGNQQLKGMRQRKSGSEEEMQRTN